MAKSKKSGTNPEPEVQTAQEEKKEPLMYIGPTIPGVATQNRVYDGIPEGLKEAINEVPEIGNLLIQIKDYPEAERMIHSGKGYAASAFKAAAEYKKGGNN